MSGETPKEENPPSQQDIDALLNAADAQKDPTSDAGETAPPPPVDGTNPDPADAPAQDAGSPADQPTPPGDNAPDADSADAAATTDTPTPDADSADAAATADTPTPDEEPAAEDAAKASDDAAAEDAREPNATDATAPAEDPQAGADDDAQPATSSLSQDDIDAALGAATDAAEPEADASEPPQKLDTAGRPFDEAAAMMEAAIAEEQAAAKAQQAAEPSPAPQQPSPLPENAVTLDLPDFGSDATDATDAPRGQGIDLLNNVDLNVKIELGRAKMYIEEVLKLGEGSVVELDKLAGDPVDILVNEKLVARGEVLVLNDNFCVRISEIVAGPAHSAEAQAAAS